MRHQIWIEDYDFNGVHVHRGVISEWSDKMGPDAAIT
jgi:hypothetical protein